jgi:enoyl-CoA hydratase/carnithine racemase
LRDDDPRGPSSRALGYWENGEIWCEMYALIPTMAKPVIAAVNGVAVAGGLDIPRF